MKMAPVKSSNVEGVGYDPATQTMHVRFRGVATYEHTGVSLGDHAAFMLASSKGVHYSAKFKGQHDAKKIQP